MKKKVKFSFKLKKKKIERDENADTRPEEMT